METTNQKTYNDGINTLNRWAYAYYTLNETIVPDSKYDELYHKIKEMEEADPSMVSPLSPTQRIGDRTSEGFVKAKHARKMYSIEDHFEIGEVVEWMSKHPSGTAYCCEPKYDGASLNLAYINGSLAQAITRGDGEEGEDITANMPYIKGIPLSIPYAGRVEIRGEVTMFKDDLDTINEWREENGKKAFKNTRNASSGGLRSLESRSVKAYNLRFSPYAIGENELDLHTHSDEGKWALSQGFTNWNTNAFRLFDNAEDIEQFYIEMIENRANYPMELDGMVIKVDSLAQQEEMGFTNKHPRWAVAFKFPATEKTTRLLGVTLQTGKTGAITPVGILEPVEIGGALISRVTLHNFDEIARKDFRIGDEVVIIRSGDVIPKLQYVIVESRDGTEQIIERPSECPSCGCTELNNSQTALICTNPRCDAKIKEILKYAVGKKALSIDSLGISTINELVDREMIHTVGGLWNLTLEQFLSLDGFKETKAKKIYSAVHRIVGKTDAYRVLNALDIPLIGETASKKLVKVFGARIFKPITEPISYEELIAVEDIGEESAKSFVDFMARDHALVIDLYSTLDPVFAEEVSLGNAFEGKKFVITGTLSKDRGHFKSLIEAHGGKVSGSVSKNTDYLLAGENAGSKESDANRLGVIVLDEVALFVLIQ